MWHTAMLLCRSKLRLELVGIVVVGECLIFLLVSIEHEGGFVQLNQMRKITATVGLFEVKL